MDRTDFWLELSQLMEEHDLLRHPFYEAWRAGSLTLHDLREYASEYYHHVASFPVYLREFAARLPLGDLRQSVLANLWDELGMNAGTNRAHSLLWIDFAVGTGVLPNDVFARSPMREVAALIETFLTFACSGTSAEVLAAFYVYESQVPRIAREKAETLRTKYGLDTAACGYFTLHATADIAHARVWREQLDRLLSADAKAPKPAMVAAERAAKALWKALDGINAKRLMRSGRPASNLN
jgi:pyrroloquinoline-quinone synthase